MSADAGTNQVDDAGRSLLVADKEETLSGVGSPSDIVVGVFGRLLHLLVVAQSLGLESIGAKEEEVLGGDEVPDGVEWSVACHSRVVRGGRNGVPICTCAYAGSERRLQLTWGNWHPGPCGSGGPPQRA